MFLLLPVTLYYFSPVLSLQAAATGIVAGSVIVFGLLLLSSLFVGRLFCGWACPAGGAQELVGILRRSPPLRKRIGWVKWLVWAPWFLGLIYLFVRAQGVRRVDFLYQTRSGVSVTDLPGLIAYVSVVSTFALLALVVGRRAGCHTLCWMAPFMVIGRRVRNVLAWPALRLKTNPAACVQCGTCTRACPMSIDVTRRVRTGRLETQDCILCGNCVDTCEHSAIRYTFSGGR
jgi:polyferredoxin